MKTVRRSVDRPLEPGSCRSVQRSGSVARVPEQLNSRSLALFCSQVEGGIVGSYGPGAKGLDDLVFAQGIRENPLRSSVRL